MVYGAELERERCKDMNEMQAKRLKPGFVGMIVKIGQEHRVKVSLRIRVRGTVVKLENW